jgi:MoaA/NifB/PqqE/SkfB family radical SAM enzyme
MKVLKGTPRHLNKSGQLSGFAYLMLNLPFRCNYRCLKCFNLINNVPITSGTPIALEEIEQKIIEAKEMGGKAVVIAGEGEPTLDPNIKRIVFKIDSLGMIPVVYSNGSTLTPEVAKYYCDHNTSLVIALDSLSERTYDFLTGTKHLLPKVLKNIETTRKIYLNSIEEKDGFRIVKLAENVTITSINKKEINDIKKYCGEDVYFVCNPLACYGNSIANWRSLITGNDDLASYGEIIKKFSESGGPLTLNKVCLCGFSNNGIGISPSGDYMTCAYTSETNGLLGNIRKISLAEAYDQKSMIEREHYKLHGNVPCLIRDRHFKEYITTLKNKKNPLNNIEIRNKSEKLINIV